MPKKPAKLPEYIKCGNPACGRKLLASGYALDIPIGTPPERVHGALVIGKENRTVRCSLCGHFTIQAD